MEFESVNLETFTLGKLGSRNKECVKLLLCLESAQDYESSARDEIAYKLNELADKIRNGENPSR